MQTSSSRNNTTQLSSNSSSNVKTIKLTTTASPFTVSSANNIVYTGDDSTCISTGNTSRYGYLSMYTNDAMDVMMAYLNEDELGMILDALSERNLSDYKYSLVLKTFLLKRHFSEDFLMKYIPVEHIKDYASEIMENHSPDINTGQYAQIALLLDLK